MDLGYFWLSAEQFGGSNRIPQVSLSGFCQHLSKYRCRNGLTKAPFDGLDALARGVRRQMEVSLLRLRSERPELSCPRG